MHVDKIADAAVKVAQARVPEHVRQGYLSGYEARCQARGVDPAAAVKAAGVAHMLGKGLGYLGGKAKAIRQAGVVNSVTGAVKGYADDVGKAFAEGKAMGLAPAAAKAAPAAAKVAPAAAPAAAAVPAAVAPAVAPAAAVAPAVAPAAAAAAAAKGRSLGSAFRTSAPVRGVRGFLRDLAGGRARHLGNKLNLADRALADARNALQLPAGAGAADAAAFNELLAPLTQRAEQLRRLHQRAVAARFKARLGAGAAAGAYMLGKNRGYGAAGEAALNDYYG